MTDVANTYDIGDLVRCSVTFTNAAGTPTDPTAIIGEFQDPSGNETSYTHGVDVELVKDDTGDFHFDVVIDESGYWFYRFAGTGTVVAAAECFFIVRASEF